MRIISSSNTVVDIELTQKDLAAHGFNSDQDYDPHFMNTLTNAVMPLIAGTPLWSGGEQSVTFRLIQGNLGTYILRVAAIDANNPLAVLFDMLGMPVEAMPNQSCSRQQQPQFHNQCSACRRFSDDRKVVVVKIDTLDEVIDLCKNISRRYAHIVHSSLFKLGGVFHLVIDAGDKAGVDRVRSEVSEFFEYTLARDTVFTHYSEHAEVIVAVDAVGNLARI